MANLYLLILCVPICKFWSAVLSLLWLIWYNMTDCVYNVSINLKSQSTSQSKDSRMIWPKIAARIVCRSEWVCMLRICYIIVQCVWDSFDFQNEEIKSHRKYFSEHILQPPTLDPSMAYFASMFLNKHEIPFFLVVVTLKNLRRCSCFLNAHECDRKLNSPPITSTIYRCIFFREIHVLHI